MPKSILCRLVGAYHRPPAQLILDNLPANTPLILDPEPDNPWDSNAIKVLLSIDDIPTNDEFTSQLPNYGKTFEDIIDQTVEFNGFHLGYIAMSGSKTADGFPGNLDALDLMAACPNHHAILAFTPEGKPLVKLTED